MNLFFKWLFGNASEQEMDDLADRMIGSVKKTMEKEAQQFDDMAREYEKVKKPALGHLYKNRGLDDPENKSKEDFIGACWNVFFHYLLAILAQLSEVWS